MTGCSTISYHRLTPAARCTIQNYGMTVAGYVRAAGWEDGDWHGDRCGCTDDRCIGHHHDANEDCQCLPVLIEKALGWVYVPGHEPLMVSGLPTRRNGMCLGSYRSTAAGDCDQCGATAEQLARGSS